MTYVATASWTGEELPPTSRSRHNDDVEEGGSSWRSWHSDHEDEEAQRAMLPSENVMLHKGGAVYLSSALPVLLVFGFAFVVILGLLVSHHGLGWLLGWLVPFGMSPGVFMIEFLPLLLVAFVPCVNGARACLREANALQPHAAAAHVLSWKIMSSPPGVPAEALLKRKARLGARVLRRAGMGVRAATQMLGSGYSMRLEREFSREGVTPRARVCSAISNYDRLTP